MEQPRDLKEELRETLLEDLPLLEALATNGRTLEQYTRKMKLKKKKN